MDFGVFAFYASLMITKKLKVNVAGDASPLEQEAAPVNEKSAELDDILLPH